MTSSPPRSAGERQYRSWGEAQIGRFLDRYTIPYFYEHPLAVVDRGKTRIWYPDFQLRGYGVLIEYCGRMRDPDYAAGVARKQDVYAANGIDTLMITPNQFRGNWPGRLLDTIEQILVERASAFRKARTVGWPPKMQ